MKNIFKRVVDWFFYNFLNEVIEEQFEINIYLTVEEKIVKELTMKHLPRKGDFILFSLSGKMDSLLFEVNRITISQGGAVAYLNGKII